MATSVSSCTGCQRGHAQCHGLCPMAGNRARKRHHDAPMSHFLSIHGNKQHSYSAHFGHIWGLMCTEPKTRRFCNLCRTAMGGVSSTAALCTGLGFELQMLTENQHLGVSSVSVLTARSGSRSSPCILLKIHCVVRGAALQLALMQARCCPAPRANTYSAPVLRAANGKIGC